MLLPSRSVSGWVGPLDPDDFYRFTLTEATRLAVSLGGGGAVTLLDGNGAALNADTAQRDLREGSIVRSLGPGDYTLRVSATTGAPAGETYALTLAHAAAAQPATAVADQAPNQLAESRDLGMLAGGSRSLADWVGPGDTADVYRFTLAAESRVETRLAGLTDGATLELLDLAGTVLRAVQGSAVRDASLIAQLAAGDYHLRVLPAGGATGYRLQTGAEPLRDEAGNAAATARSLGALGTAAVVAGDRVGATDPEDWYAFTLAATATVSLRLSPGFEGVAGTLRLALADAGGAEIATDTASALGDGALGWTLAAGSWRVRVGGGEAATDYGLTLRATPVADSAGGSLGTARQLGTLPAPGSATTVAVTEWVGAADPDDVLAFTLAAPTTLAIALNSQGGAPAMQLRDGGGASLTSATASWLGSDGVIRLSLAAGPYALWVQTTDVRGSGYAVSFATAPPAMGSAGADLAGNTLGGGRAIAAPGAAVQRFADWVGDADPDDWYRFSLAADALVDLRATFQGSGTGTLTLTDGGGLLLMNGSGSAASDASLLRMLDAGSYAVRVSGSGAAGLGYSLAVQGQAVPDGAGDTRAAGRSLGALGATPLAVQDHVGTADPADWYGFTLAGAALVTLSVGGLRAAVRVAVTDAAGVEQLATEARPESDGSLRLALPAGGPWHVSVLPVAGSTPYALSLSASALQDSGGATAGGAPALVPAQFLGGTAAPDLVQGSAFADEIEGGAGPDTIGGLAGADTIWGGQGVDLLTGGAGNDLLHGATEHDAALWAGPRSDFLLRSFVSGGQVVTTVTDTTGAEGADTLVGVETLGFRSGNQAFGVAGLQQNRTANFDAGRFDDALFWNTATGLVAYSNLGPGGQSIGFATVLSAMPSGWRVIGRGDLNLDGRADILVQDGNTGSTFYVDIADGSPAFRVVTVTGAPSLRAVAAGDFNGDGQNDVLFREESGFLFAAEMQGGSFARWVFVANLGTGWRPVGVGDLNRDGSSDVVFQDLVFGTTFYRDVANGSWGYAAGGLGTTWQGRAVADVNGDGFADVVFRNAHTGDVWYVDMVGGSGLGAAWGVVAPRFLGWDVRGAIDPDNDGYADLVFQNLADGAAYWREMEAGVATGHWGLLAQPFGAAWIIGL